MNCQIKLQFLTSIYQKLDSGKILGDLRPLVDSIKRHGLLHPVVITEDKHS